MKNIKSYLYILWQLVKTDLLIYKEVFVSQIIDTFILTISIVCVVTYVFPQLGMNKGYGEFFAIGAIFSSCLFQIFPVAVAFVSDITGNKTITYPLTLPLPSWMVLAKQAVSFTLTTIPTSIIVLPIAKLLLWNRMDLSNFSLLKFIPMFLMLNVFSGLFSIFISSSVKNMGNIGKVWVRILFPLWFFGGSQFSWQTLYGISPKLAYLDLANPMLYATEGIRAATLGQQGNLPFWICFMMLIVFGITFGTIGILRLKKRLDFV